MRTKSLVVIVMSMLIVGMLVSACSSDSNEMDHSEMDHSISGELPEGIQVAINPKYQIGSKAFMKTGHMKGMEGAEATIVGAFNTKVYAVSYTPVTGGDRVENHKWIVHEEITDFGADSFQPGAEVMINTDHMTGMKGAKGVIDSVEETTVYMVDFILTNNGNIIQNHKWVTESELSSQ